MRSPVLVAHNILMLGHDWAMRRWFLREHFTLEEYTEEHTEFILDAIGARVGAASASGALKDS